MDSGTIPLRTVTVWEQILSSSDELQWSPLDLFAIRGELVFID